MLFDFLCSCTSSLTFSLWHRRDRCY
uniref:Uncharacterized protein n=1 Tax=Rhizophora mucronata TaxID=61149 RepID=A0A2P2JVB1_RHIMU